MKLLTVASLIGLWALSWALIVSNNDLRPSPEGAARLLLKRQLPLRREAEAPTTQPRTRVIHIVDR
jgi:hypothetical protein